MTMGIADESSLRRIGWLAAGWGAAGAITFAGGGQWRRAVVLTASAAMVIVALRYLTTAVRRLEVGPAGEIRRGGLALLGWWIILPAAVVAALVFGSHDYLAVILGISSVPLGVISEAAVRLAAGPGGEERPGGG